MGLSGCALERPGTDVWPLMVNPPKKGTGRPAGVFERQDFVLLRYDPNDSDPGDFCGRRGLFGQNGVSFVPCQGVGRRLRLGVWQMWRGGF
jgi:hypothetical protein